MKIEGTKNYKEDLTQALKELLQNYQIQPNIQVNNNSTPKPGECLNNCVNSTIA